MIDKTMNWTAPLGWTPRYGDYMSAQRVPGGGEGVNCEGLLTDVNIFFPSS